MISQTQSGFPLGFYNTNFVYYPLPYRAVGGRWEQHIAGGNINLSALSSASVPYGLYGRLALIAMINLASGEDRFVVFSVYETLKKIKLIKPTGTQLEKFIVQLENWASTAISLRYARPDRIDIFNLFLVEEASISLLKDSEKTAEKSRSAIRFSERGAEFLKTSAFPIPQDAISQIDSAFEFDTLSWLISSIYQIRERKEPCLVPWRRLSAQFNISPKNISRFREQFSKSLFELKAAYYPAARVRRYQEGIEISPSPLLVPERGRALLKMPDFQKIQGGV